MSEQLAQEALTEVLAFIGAPTDGVAALADDDICPIKTQVSGAHLKRWHAALTAPTRDGEVGRLREALKQVRAEIGPAKAYAESLGLEGGKLPSAVHIKLDLIDGYARAALATKAEEA